MPARRRGQYLVYLLRANTRGRPRRLHRLSDLDGQGTDLLASIEQQLSALGPGMQRASDDVGFRIRDLDRAGRTLFIRMSQGPLGAPGEWYDMDLDQAQALTDRQPALSDLRGLVAIPEKAPFGLLFVERIARRHIRDIVRDSALVPISNETRLVIRSAAFTDAGDWRTFLADKQPLRVTQMLRPRSSADTVAEPDETVIKVAVEGRGVGRGRGDALREWLVSRAARKEEELQLLVQGSTLEDDAEIQAQVRALEDQGPVDQEVDAQLGGFIPFNTSGYEHQRYEVSFGDRRPERNFTIERGELPQFVYELEGDRLSDDQLRQTWVSHAARVFRAYQTPLPGSWARGG